MAKTVPYFYYTINRKKIKHKTIANTLSGRILTKNEKRSKYTLYLLHLILLCNFIFFLLVERKIAHVYINVYVLFFNILSLFK